MLEIARRDCRAINIEQPMEELDFRLVHAAGNTVNNEEISDKIFGASVQNAYRLVRTVEMFQWKQNSETRERNGRR